jgi:hypothetical protein
MKKFLIKASTVLLLLVTVNSAIGVMKPFNEEEPPLFGSGQVDTDIVLFNEEEPPLF